MWLGSLSEMAAEAVLPHWTAAPYQKPPETTPRANRPRAALMRNQTKLKKNKNKEKRQNWEKPKRLEEKGVASSFSCLLLAEEGCIGRVGRLNLHLKEAKRNKEVLHTKGVRLRVN